MNKPSAESAYVFTHALLQRACYELMLPSRRGELHRRALEYLQGSGLAAPDELAAHALSGQAGATPEEAARLKALRRDLLREAAEAAIATYSNERGLALLDDLFMCEGVSEGERVRLLCRRAELLNRMGRMEAAVTEAERALATAQHLGDALEVTRAQLMLGCCCLDTSQNARAPGLLAVAVEACERLREPQMQQEALLSLARSLHTAGRPHDALPYAQRALAIGQSSGDPLLLTRCHQQMMSILAQLQRSDEAQAYVEPLKAALESSPNPGLRCAMATTLASFSHGQDRLEEAMEYHRRASTEAATAGLHAEVARAEVNLGGLARQLGRYNEGLKHVDKAASMARELGNVRVLWFALRNRYDILDAIGDHRAALNAATMAARVAQSASMAWHYLVSCAQQAAAFLELGQAEDALDCVDAALTAPRAGQYLNFVLAKLHAERGCALFRLGRPEAARESVREMEHFLKLAGSEPDYDSQRWIQEARSHAAA